MAKPFLLVLAAVLVALACGSGSSAGAGTAAGEPRGVVSSGEASPRGYREAAPAPAEAVPDDAGTGGFSGSDTSDTPAANATLHGDRGVCVPCILGECPPLFHCSHGCCWFR
mmetsp:Transcript_16049/g.43288  ORF Transcript_16049/g.43288 Transcript_16049/m.43288 type:complete len:112 (-) Transcript_16049:170-505(-)